ncbi:hypothetical protein [Mycobacterium intracellulare]|uniref:hypothetical protein n=1 Tax=Mycobacterium intracellulare TaxID=1767 RepID=UPI001EEEB660|nr:hypothetical protein [Mycobacterium intracellulare]MEE3755254.1 hypothetical protein [Mycobacterium intracellulare]
MDVVKRVDQLAVGDEIVEDNGSYRQVRGMNLPGTDRNPNKTIVRVDLGYGWLSWPVAKTVRVISSSTP